MKRATVGAFCAVFMAVHASGDALVTQQLTLNPGWNAVYLNVAPDSTADEIFASWPVESVSAYNADSFRYTESTAGGLTGEPVVRASYWVWSRKEGYASTLKALAADTVLLCRSTNDTAFTVTLAGTPAAPRIAWHASNKDNREMLNAIGVRLGGTVAAADWFAGSPKTEGTPFYRISGKDDTPLFVSVASGFGANRTENLNDGSVVFVSGAEVGDWSGPLYISPRAGIDFGNDGTIDEVTIRNDGEAAKQVRITYAAAADSSIGSIAPALLYCDGGKGDGTVGGGWTSAASPGMELSCSLEPGQTWRVFFALDRSKLGNTGAPLAGVLEIAEQGGTLSKAWLAVKAADSKGLNPWPQGVWEAKIRLNKVSYYQKDGDRFDDVAAGGVMPVKVFLIVDEAGSAKLVQRTHVNGLLLSSAFLPVDLGEVPATGDFASRHLNFIYMIGAESPSNPFRHALHPFFDGKQMDFKTPAPSGDDFGNYVGSVKPEWFSIGGEVDFTFDENTATAWSPQEVLTGTAKWCYTGVRRDGPVVAQGRFTMQRVATACDTP